MNVSTTARYCSPSPVVRQRAIEQTQRLLRYNRSIRGIELIFDRQRALRSVEAIVHLTRAAPVVMRSEATTFSAAVESLMDGLARRLKRERGRRRSRRAAAADPSQPSASA
ncbi:MAG: HPF/RaiA family ribosome-associated protein [Longimicrobiales bacterium]